MAPPVGPSWPPVLLLFQLILCLFCRLEASASLAEDAAHSSCDPALCDSLRKAAELKYETRYHNDTSVSGRFTPRQASCVVLRTYGRCLRGMRSTCQGIVGYHYRKSYWDTEMRGKSCEDDGFVYEPGAGEPLPTPAPACAYRGGSPVKFCSLFGDPHLRTFGGEFATCRVVGAWPLVDNAFLTVQVSNTALMSGGVSASTRLTVIVRNIHDEDCGPTEAAYYHASAAHLPDSFSNGKQEFGRHRGVQLTAKDPGGHVEIFLKYVNTTVSVRRVGLYLMVSVSMPAVFLNKTIDGTGSEPRIQQLCTDGCLPWQRIDYQRALHAAQAARADDVRAAVAECRRRDLTDYFLDACAFDLLTTGDLNFTEAAASAADDLRRLRPSEWDAVAKRTVLESPPATPSPAHSGAASHRRSLWSWFWTVLLSVVFCSILLH